MATRSGGKKPPAKNKTPPASFQDNLEAQERSRSEGVQSVRAASRKRPFFSGWTVLIIVLLMSSAVSIWGLRQSAFLQESMDMNTPEAIFKLEAMPSGTAPDQMPGQNAEASDPFSESSLESSLSPIEGRRADELGEPDGSRKTARRLAALEAGLVSLGNGLSAVSSLVSRKTTPDLAMVRALESIEVSMATLMERMAGLESRLKRIEISSEKGWALVVAGAELRAALRGSAPFAVELEVFRGTLAGLHGPDGEEGALIKTLAALDGYASEGIPDMRTLGPEFDALVSRIVAAAEDDSVSESTSGSASEDESLMKTLREHLRSLITIRRTGSGLAGSSAEAVVARAEAALKADSLITAVSELETLQGHRGTLVATWLNGARARLAAVRSLTEISRRVTAVLARQEMLDAGEGAGG